MEYIVLAYYLFTPIENPAREVKNHKNFLKDRDIRCRIYIGFEGINGQMSASVQAAKEYMQWLKDDSRFQNIEFKLQQCSEHTFAKATVKVKEQIVALDAKVDLKQKGTYLSSEEWAKMIESKDDQTLVLDVRNTYETAIGHFDGAYCPQLETFREFPQFTDSLKEKYDPETTTVMMCCTGGIRCEVYSALMRQKGYKKIYQLQGGMLKYAETMGAKHWRGKLFVFDDRLAVSMGPQETEEVISRCLHCGDLSDTYLNCAHMDCNRLFLSCAKCAQKTKGCCSEDCTQAKRVRPYEPAERPKPFRKLKDKKS